ncbi:ABC transporter ATP-binding protein [Actinobacteria bacterium YIM 96077]|uniref:Methionine ABC transporter ATP-binding protein n=1 Tax=Phytoactinopolyspora halophila TaxID=1981511 RepID=A0A329QYL2_9ACTN|nr:ABC transporter ATP-binding protein [Phytoactinopolyspora halophila]AYY15367.1 ABC transporter ATP-binding protein [Actinobacteria bacterium YIM 96077]RAW16412.1 methionine ABC transporter ATP-binding protein [Phytoactinopolyspora halophila]
MTGPALEPDVTLSATAPVLEVRDLSVEFRTPHGTVNAVNGVSFALDRGETLAILGESGSGKSVTAQAVMDLIDSPPGFVTGGEILFHGQDLLANRHLHHQVRGQSITMIFQDALSALNPVFTVGWQIGEQLRVHRGMSRRDARARVIELMELVKIPYAAARVDDYPHEFSGGMRQRVMIAMALALDPEVLIADEPTTALDVTVQAQVMALLEDLQRDLGMSLILITHDLGVVTDMAHRVSVMYAGRVVEEGDVYSVFKNPAHPYTEGLMSSMPKATHGDQKLVPITGAPPSLANIPSGCPFHPRCPYMRPDTCVNEHPPLREVVAGRRSACHFAEEVFS